MCNHTLRFALKTFDPPLSQLDCLYLAAAAWQFLHPCRHPPSASSPALWSVSPQCSLRPPSYFFPAWAPLLESQVSGKMEVGPSGSPTAWPVPSTTQLMCQLPAANTGECWEYFPVLGKDFGHPLPTWPGMTNGAQGQACFRAKGKVWGEADIHRCRSDLTFRGTLLCSAEDEHRLKCLSLYAVLRCP